MASYRQSTVYGNASNQVFDTNGFPRWSEFARKELWDYAQSQIPIWSDYKKLESQYQYYKDYYDNTGITPRYPYLTYADYTTPALYSALGMASHAGYKLLSPKRLYG